ncbi:MAG: hypothetical protein ACREX9_06865, partial [Gammaproteobacteria bacterium]
PFFLSSAHDDVFVNRVTIKKEWGVVLSMVGSAGQTHTIDALDTFDSKSRRSLSQNPQGTCFA